MRFSGYTTCLTSDAARLAQAAVGDMRAPVPTCPEWTVGDLVDHVAMVYAHKVECMKHNAKPDPWPPAVDPQVSELSRMRTAMGDLLAEFTARGPEGEAFTWYDPDQTVGFWMRRMAQETVIHRVDAELAADVEISPIDPELAVDGIDELLTIFVDWSSHRWLDELREPLAKADPAPIAVASGDRVWTVRPGPDGVDVSTDEPADDAVATVSGEPADVLLWLWRRTGFETVTISGDEAPVRSLHGLLAELTG